MDRRERGWTSGGAAARAALLLLAFPCAAHAGTTGKLVGVVVDGRKEPLAGANVAIPEARLGAVTDLDGRYSVLNIPAGTYRVRFNLIGYRPVAVEDVVVTSDQTTRLDLTLVEAPLPMEEIVITATRPVVDVNLTSNIATLSRQQIENLPVQELQDVVNLQAGVVDGHFRGGRTGEVQYQVDGVTVNNLFNNASSVRLDRSLLEEVQIVSGTFDAEYGQAMSGVVNAVLKRGTERFDWSGEAFSGGFVFGGDRRNVEFDWQPSGIQNYQLTLTGPAPLPKTVFLLSGRRYLFDDYVRGIRVFRPTDRPDSNGVLQPSGDFGDVTLGHSREWSGVAKLTNRSIPDVELNYQAILNVIEARRSSYLYRFDPDGLAKQRTFSIVHGLDWTHTLSHASYYKLSLRQNLIDYRDMAHDDLYDPRYLAGPPRSYPFIPDGVFVQGVDFTRYRQQTSAFVFDASAVSQVTREHLVKVGAELQVPWLSFGKDGSLVFNQEGGAETLQRIQNQPPDFPGVRTYRPLIGATYAQDDIDWSDLRLRAGLRLEVFDPRAWLPSDLSNPANAIQGAPVSVPRAATPKVSLMPRIGVSYPITHKAAVYFAYGHFTQMPPLGDIYSNADYTVLERLQAVDNLGKYGVLGNPDVKPEKTVQYQFGYKQELNDRLGLDVNIFYKDIRDLLGVEFISTYNDAEYTRLTNVDFGNVVGFTVSLDQRAIGLLSASLDYTWQIAEGNSSDPRETATRAENKEDPRPREVPLNWDQRHTLNMTVTLARPEDFNLSAILRVASGQPYTPTITAIFGGGQETNSGRKPDALALDLRAEKRLNVGGLRGSLFGRVFNAFDTRFFNGSVFNSTGSPYYSRDPSRDLAALEDPTRFYAPRRIEAGVTFGAGRTP